MRRLPAVVFYLALAMPAGTEDPSPSPPHGGAWLEVTDATARFEVVMAKDKKSATVYSLERDGKTPLGLKDSPELKLSALDEKNALRGKALNLKEGTASEFEFKLPPAGDGEVPKELPANGGPHGGAWIDIPGIRTLIEYCYDPKLARITIWILDKDGLTPFPLRDFPIFNVDTPMEGMVQLDGKAVGLKDGSASRFDYEGADLADRPPGLASRFVIRIDDKTYQAPIINREHGHMHGPIKDPEPK